MHDVAEFLETDLGKRKLTYVGVTMPLVILWHPLPHDGFFFSPKTLFLMAVLVYCVNIAYVFEQEFLV